MYFEKRTAQSYRLAACIFAVSILTLAGAAMPAAAQIYTDLHDFNASAGDPTSFNPTRLAQGRDGNFYLESRSGGTSGQGTVASVSPAGTVHIVLNFNGTNGSMETGGMTLGNDGNLYGDTLTGGTSNDGVTFKVTPTGTYTALHNFTNTGDGNSPVNALVQEIDGNFYGLTDSSPETFYKVTPAGKLTTLHTFTTAEGFQGGQLTQGTDGSFYGGLNLGGAHGFGTAFKVTATGKVTVLHNFTDADGTDAATGMVQAPSGLFFGTATLGGTSNAGVVYKLTSSGTYTVVHQLNGTSDGSSTYELTLATDGNFYGLTNVAGGASGCGTIFKVTQAGVFSVLHSFTTATGCNPSVSLTQGTDGKLYGVTNNGGAHGNGAFFSFDVGLAPFILLQSASGKVGSSVGILGEGFSSSSVVKFNGVTAAFTLTAPGFITATVPAGATTGFVTVTTGTITLKSTQKYLVHNAWAAGAPMPTAREGGAIGVINGKVYVVSGVAASTFVASNEIYNPATNVWTTGAPIPTPRFVPASAVVKNILYVMGGITDTSQTPRNIVEAYNPATNTWTTKTPMPTADDSMNAIVDGSFIYVIGGYTGGRSPIVQRYDPATNTWTTEAPMLLAKSGTTLGLSGTAIVATGGLDSTNNPNGDTEKYVPSTNTWTTVKADPTPRDNACGETISSLLYVAGGSASAGFGNVTSLNESYNLSKNAWSTVAPMLQPLAVAMPASLNSLMYCIGGSDDGRLFAGHVYNNVQIYQP